MKYMYVCTDEKIKTIIVQFIQYHPVHLKKRVGRQIKGSLVILSFFGGHLIVSSIVFILIISIKGSPLIGNIIKIFFPSKL